MYTLPVTTISGQTTTLEQYRGRVMLIVNTASACGYTPQYAGLEKLWTRYHELGLTVLGFPCNQFGAQELGGDREIAQFCQINYGVSFPMFSKIKVNGSDAHPLFVWLKDNAPGLLGTKAIKWNFTKFLVSRDGSKVIRFGTRTKPKELISAIEAML